MEFKQPNRYKDGRQPLATPQRSGPPPVRPVPPQTVAPTDSAVEPSATKKSIPRSMQATIRTYTRRLLSRRRNIAIITIALVIIGSLLAVTLINQRSEADNLANAEGIVSGTPDYKTLHPTGKSVDELGGWKRISPAKKDPVFAYTDTIDNVSVSVSQQPLPESFAGNVDSQVAELAKKFNATTKLSTSDTSLYVGTSAKGPQSVIFAKDTVLILIKSQNKIDNTSWEKYVSSLN